MLQRSFYFYRRPFFLTLFCCPKVMLLESISYKSSVQGGLAMCKGPTSMLPWNWGLTNYINDHQL